MFVVGHKYLIVCNAIAVFVDHRRHCRVLASFNVANKVYLLRFCVCVCVCAVVVDLIADTKRR